MDIIKKYIWDYCMKKAREAEKQKKEVASEEGLDHVYYEAAGEARAYRDILEHLDPFIA